jgi:hypothetical protein
MLSLDCPRQSTASAEALDWSMADTLPELHWACRGGLE